MKLIFILLLVFMLLIFLFAFTLVIWAFNYLKNILKIKSKRQDKRSYSQGQNTSKQHNSTQATTSFDKRNIGHNEGEYVDYEEIH